MAGSTSPWAVNSSSIEEGSHRAGPSWGNRVYGAAERRRLADTQETEKVDALNRVDVAIDSQPPSLPAKLQSVDPERLSDEERLEELTDLLVQALGRLLAKSERGLDCSDLSSIPLSRDENCDP